MDGLLGRAAATFTDVVRRHEKELRSIHGRIGSLNSNGCDLPWEDYLSLSLILLEFSPDLVVELGRGLGTSTALFRYWNFNIVSICNSLLWQKVSVGALRKVKRIDWSEGVDARVEDIRAIDFRPLISHAKRVLVFWDAHGVEIAEAVFQGLLPALAGRDSLVACHDMRDSRYFVPDAGFNWFHRGHVMSTFEQIGPIAEFCATRGIEFHSPTHQLMTEAKDLWPHPWPYCYWHYFRLS